VEHALHRTAGEMKETIAKGFVLGMLGVSLATTTCSRTAVVDAPPSMPSGHASVGHPSPGHPPAGHPSTGPMLPHGHPPVGASDGEGVSGTVTLAPALQSKAPAGAALYLIARSTKDKRIVAVQKEDAATFPRAFELSANDAMTEGTAFEGTLEITARLSRTGDAAPAAGDLEGRVAGVPAGSRAVRVQLDTVRP
jgi:hypothetical protein